MAFGYKSNEAKIWANRVIECLNGDADSVRSCSIKFNAQMEELVQPNVWTGSAAMKNFQNFMDVHQSLINFVNAFGNSFSEAMTEVAQGVANLEVQNLGNSSVATTFGQLDFAQLTAMSETNINTTEDPYYDYNIIQSIGSELKSIKGTLVIVKDKLISEISLLNNADFWVGNAAERAKEELLNVVNTNTEIIFKNLDICINNISAAAEAAQMADQG